MLTSALALSTDGRYIYSILHGKTKPNISSWLIFTISQVCVLFSAYSLWAQESLFLIGTFACLNFFILILSFKYGIVQVSNFEKILFWLFIISMILWGMTNNPWYVLLINTCIDFIAYVGIAYKLYKNPGTEDHLAWFISVMAYSLNLVIIVHWIPQEYLFSVSNVCMGVLLFVLSFRKPILELSEKK